VSLERVLVVALALTSTLAAGLAADATGDARLPPRRLALIVVANVAVLPALAYAILRLGAIDADRGLLLAAAAPGGSTGPLLAVLGGGDAPIAARTFVALSLAGVAAALIATAAFDVAGVGKVLAASAIVVASTVGPLVVGLALRARRPRRAVAWQPWLARLSLALLVATIALLAARHGGAARALDVMIGAAITLLALAIGVAADGRAARIAVAQVSAVRNLTLVLLVLAVVGAPPAETMGALGYGLAMYVIALAAAAWTRRSGR